MKISLKKKQIKETSPAQRKLKGYQHAYIQVNSNFSGSLKQKNQVSQGQMLVSTSETQIFKLDFLVQSYEQLISKFKYQRKEFLETMKTQFQRHLYYYSQIITLTKSYEQNTKKYLRSKLQDISNVFQLKISFFQMKLKNARKILFENSNIDFLFAQKKNKIKNSQSKIGLEIGKTSSYQDGLDFDEELKQIYSQKGFEIDLAFIQKQKIQESLQNIKIELIRDWQVQQSLSVSFSSFSNPEQSENTFKDIQSELQLENQHHFNSSLIEIANQRGNFEKSPTKYPYCSNETNTSAKEKPTVLSATIKFNPKKEEINDNYEF